MKGKISFRFCPLPLDLLDRLRAHELDANAVLLLSLAIREADEHGKIRMPRRGGALGLGLHPRAVASLAGRLVRAGYIQIDQAGGPGRGATTYSIGPTLALLAGDKGAAIRAARQAANGADGASEAPPDETLDGTSSAPLDGAATAPLDGAPGVPPLIDRSIDMGDGEMKDQKTKTGDTRPKTATAGARATAPPAQDERQDDGDDEEENERSSNDGFSGRRDSEPLVPGGLRRLNRCVNIYLNLMRLHRGVANPVVTAKDRGVFRAYLEGQPDDEVVGRVIEAFVLDNDNFVTNNGWPLWLLVRRHNAYAARGAGQAGRRLATDQSPSAERVRILREAFTKAWSAKYGRPRIEPSGDSETKPALEVISHYEASGEAEPFEAWAIRIVQGYLEMDDRYIVERAHPFHVLPFRIDRLLARKPASRRDRGTNAADWEDETRDAEEIGDGGTVQ